MPPAEPDSHAKRSKAETEPMLEIPDELSPALRLVFQALFREIRENRREVAGLRDDVAAVQGRLADGRAEFAKINLRLDYMGADSAKREAREANDAASKSAPAWWVPIVLSSLVSAPLGALALFLLHGTAAAAH